TDCTPRSFAACTGSVLCFTYFRTELVGRTARLCSEARRLMTASAMPIPQLSLPACPERSRNGRTAIVCGELAVGAEVDAGLGDVSDLRPGKKYHPTTTSANASMPSPIRMGMLRAKSSGDVRPAVCAAR